MYVGVSISMLELLLTLILKEVHGIIFNALIKYGFLFHSYYRVCS
jgi:hypothetical protein